MPRQLQPYRIPDRTEEGDIVRSIAVVGHESRKNSWTVGSYKKKRPTMLALCVMTVHCAGQL
jgi:hypothetical protein